MLKNTISTFALAILLSMIFPQASIGSSEPNETSHIAGAICAEDGSPAKGVRVYCLYMNRDIPWEFGHQLSDDQGRYVFELPASRKHWPVGRTCYIQAGGKASTFVRSKEFTALPLTKISVEDLIVRPFSASVKGRVVYEDGRPAANLAFGHVSRNASPIDPAKPPRTNNDGEFTIEHLLPDELYSFWVFTEPNVIHLWKRLDPNVPEAQLTLQKRGCVELPTDWLYGGHTHEAIARTMVYAENDSIEFRFPDLNGNVVSLSDDRFKNKAVIVNLMGTWCGGCIQEAPYLAEFSDKYKEEGLEVVSISFEAEPKDKAIDTISSFVNKHNIDYPVLYGGTAKRGYVESVVAHLRLFHGYPTTIYLDRSHKVEFIQAGFWIHTDPHKKWQLALMEKHIEAILADEK